MEAAALVLAALVLAALVLAALVLAALVLAALVLLIVAHVGSLEADDVRDLWLPTAIRSS